MMEKIKSSLNPNFTWNITCKEFALSEAEIEFIKTFNPPVYHNDLSCKLWSYDEKMPSGRWLENIVYNNSLTKARALVV